MRRVLGFLFGLAGASSAVASGSSTTTPTDHQNAPQAKPAAHASAAAPARAKPAPVHLAPADEYFGPLKMSVLGIRNEIHDLAIRYDVRADVGHALAKQIMGTALMTEASLADWEKKYPSDNQLARDVYLLQHLYAKIDFDDARNKAKYCAKWLISRYPKTWYAKNMRLTMVHAAPPQPAASLQPQPSPEASSAPPASSPTGAAGAVNSNPEPGAVNASPAAGAVDSVPAPVPQSMPGTVVPVPEPTPK